MASSYTTLLGLVQPVTGDLAGTWGTVVNAQLTQLVEDAIAGEASADVTSSDWTLTTTGSGAQNQARMAILIPTGTPGTTRYITAPASSKAYVVINKSDSTVYLRGTGPTTGDFVLAGSSALFAWNGTDFLKIAGGSGGATGGGTNQAFFLNDLTITSNYSIPASKNAGTFGPVSINSGVTVTIPSTSVWSVV
jgi:hypothetical protein